jgi:EAL and modified HD-GYP domain-containing signal transduction protein
MATVSLKPLNSLEHSTSEAVRTSPVPMESFRYVARQPILDVRGQVHGYELLFRSGPTSVEFSGDGDAATRIVLDSSVLMGLDRLTGGLPMFVNCTREALMRGLVKVLPAEHTVLELLETLEPNAGLLKACKELKARGFRLALDDFVWSPKWQPLLELADYVKVDFSQTTSRQRAELKRRIGSRPIKLIMERVETQKEHALSIKEGFTLFQGYFFCRPMLMQNRNVPPNRVVHLEILQAVLECPLDIKQISALVKRDPSLTYRLLRIVNSPIYATRQVVSSIQDALVLVGDEMFRRIAMLATASEMKGNHPSELLRMAFLRGRFCELAASITRKDPTEQYLLGMLSLLPAMLNVPMDSVVMALPLRNELRDALQGKDNEERTVLNWLVHYELGEWENCDQLARAAGLPEDRILQIYSEAVTWAEINMSLAAD